MKLTCIVGLGFIAALAACGSSTPAPESPSVEPPPPATATAPSEPAKSKLPPELADLEARCNLGTGEACVALGKAYYNGQGVPKDPAAGAALVRKACDAGTAADCYDVGSVLWTGEDGVPEDKPTSLAFIEKACKGGVDRACAFLGVVYQQGHGVEEDMAKARTNFEQACRLGHSVSCGFVETIDRSAARRASSSKGTGVANADVEKADEPAAKPSGPAVPGVPNANLSVGSIDVDGMTAKDISCRLESGGGFGIFGAMMGPSVAIGSLAKKKAQLDACAPGGAEPRVTWSFAGGRTTQVSVDGVPDKVKSCVEKVVKSAVATADGECAATLVAGKKK